MQAIVFLFLLGTSLNVLNTHPHNQADVLASLNQQLNHPVIEAADYSKLNK